MMRRLRAYFQSGNVKYPVKPLNVIGLMMSVVMMWILTWDVLTLHDGLIFVLALIGFMSCAFWWVKRL
jgi:hypothetical protein